MGRMGRGGGCVEERKAKDRVGGGFFGLSKLRTAGVTLLPLALFHACIDDDDSKAPSW